MHPLVSVVIATYNRAAYIVETIDSVLAQNYPQDKIEIIVVDDGSTDQTKQVLTQYKERVRYFYQENAGQTSATEKGIMASTGSILALLDSDDYWYANRLNECVDLFKDQEVVAVFNDLDFYQQNSAKTKGTFLGKKKFNAFGEPRHVLNEYLSGSQIPGSSTGGMWRMATVKEKILPFPSGLRGFQDAHLVRQAMFFGKITFINKSLGIYRIHDTNDYHSKTDKSAYITKIQTTLSDTKKINQAFNDRCKQFNIPQSTMRYKIQVHAVAEKEIIIMAQQGILNVLKYCFEKINEIGFIWSLHLFLQYILPSKISGKLNRYFFKKLGVPV